MSTFENPLLNSPAFDGSFPVISPPRVDTLTADHRTPAAATGGVAPALRVAGDGRYVFGKRLFDAAVAAAALLATAPLWLGLAAAACAGGKPITTQAKLGQRRRAIRVYRLAPLAGDGLLARVWGKLAGLPTLWNIVRGDLSWVGPRPISPRELRDVSAHQTLRFRVPPGLVCLHWLRRRANIDYAPEFDADVEYVGARSWRRDLGILCRALPGLLYGDRGGRFPDRWQVQGLTLSNLTMDEALYLIVRLARGATPAQICFLNADCVNIARRDPQYRAVVERSPWNLGDGIGIKLAGRLLGTQLRQNLCGTELFPLLCRSLMGRPEGLFLLGAEPGVTDEVVRWIEARFPGVRVKGHHHGYFTPAEEPQVLEQIRRSGAEILLVAFGAPRQDVWVAEHLHETGAKVAMGVGGLFDVYSGRYPRPPVWVRELCLTWAYRVALEPRRLWRRYLLGNGLFLARVIREAIGRRWGTMAGSR